jgi:hypothetical protein
MDDQESAPIATYPQRVDRVPDTPELSLEALEGRIAATMPATVGA